MKTKTVYKVVDVRGNRRLSVWVQSIDELCTRYYKSKYVKAPVGKLFAFDTEPNARVFANHFVAEVWEAKATGAEPLGATQILGVLGAIEQYVKAYWNRNWSGDSFAPVGTVLCDSIRLVRKV